VKPTNLCLIIILFFGLSAKGQAFTSYITGDTSDVSPSTTFGVVHMGGAGESDPAMRWFLQRANGGDIVVIRTSGSDGYNNYLYSQLGISVNSVETIVFNSAQASSDPYVLQQISNAEGIWIAGGDQSTYIDYWKDNAIEDILNDHINLHQRPIGGISAGMAILSGHHFSAANGTITSATALSNPFSTNMTLGTDFLNIPILGNVITDTHYDDPDRRGRHTAFLARLAQQQGGRMFGIACDEYTAVCIDISGNATVFGSYPQYDDNAYFLVTNCQSQFLPEVLSPGQPLTWNQNNEAVKVYAVKGDTAGSNTFDLNDWESGTGGNWEHWWVDNGILQTGPGTAPNCIFLATDPNKENQLSLFPNPGMGQIHLQRFEGSLEVLDAQGRILLKKEYGVHNHIDLTAYPSGNYWIRFKKEEAPNQALSYFKAY